LKYTKGHFHRCGKTALAVLLTGVILLLDAMAASPALHEAIHNDANQPGHECAATMFAHGKVDSATVEVPVIVVAVPIDTTPQVGFSVFSAAIENLPLVRAPPSSVSSQA
jgi:hypothetical protein